MPRSVNFWDSLTFEDIARGRSVNMFGNQNIGNLSLSNLQVSGQISHSDETVILTHWYIWVHLEGLRLRNDRHPAIEPTDDTDDVEKVMELLTHPQHVQKDTEQRIVDWVMGMVKETEDPEGAAQLYAVGDGILSGKYR